MTTSSIGRYNNPITSNRGRKATLGPIAEDTGKHQPHYLSLSPAQPPAGWLRTPLWSCASRRRQARLARSPWPPRKPPWRSVPLLAVCHLLWLPPHPSPQKENCHSRQWTASRGRPKRWQGSGWSCAAADGTPGRSRLFGDHRRSKGLFHSSEGSVEIPQPVDSQKNQHVAFLSGRNASYLFTLTQNDSLSLKRNKIYTANNYVTSVWMNFSTRKEKWLLAGSQIHWSENFQQQSGQSAHLWLFYSLFSLRREARETKRRGREGEHYTFWAFFFSHSAGLKIYFSHSRETLCVAAYEQPSFIWWNY